MKQLFRVLVMWLIGSAVLLGQGGQLDPSFGESGAGFQTTGTGDPVPYSLLTLADGSFLLAGFTNSSTQRDWVIARFTPQGLPDPTFGNGGRLILDLQGTNEAGGAMVQLVDGSLVMAGYVSNSNDQEEVIIAKFDGNGNFQSSFGVGGLLTIDFGEEVERVRNIGLLPDGGILIAGHSYGSNGGKILLGKVMPDGSLDMSFGTNGIQKVAIGYDEVYVYDLEVLSNGQFYLAGSAGFGMEQDAVVLRFNQNGSLDNSFGTGGVYLLESYAGYDDASAFQVNTDGDLIVCGSVQVEAGGYDFAVHSFKLSANGSMDTGFGIDGLSIIDLGEDGMEYPYDLILQQDDKFLICGSSPAIETDVFVMRCHPQGDLDFSFGAEGVSTIDFGTPLEVGYSMNFHQDGDLLVAGGYGDIGNAGYFLAKVKTGQTVTTKELLTEESLQVYPTISSDRVHISMNLEDSSRVEVRLLGQDGRLMASMMNEWVQAGQHEMDVMLPETLGQGMYWCTLQIANELISKPLIIPANR